MYLDIGLFLLITQYWIILKRNHIKMLCFRHCGLNIRHLTIKILPTIIQVIYIQALCIIKSVIEFLATTTIFYVYSYE